MRLPWNSFVADVFPLSETMAGTSGSEASNASRLFERNSLLLTVAPFVTVSVTAPVFSNTVFSMSSADAVPAMPADVGEPRPMITLFLIVTAPFGRTVWPLPSTIRFSQSTLPATSALRLNVVLPVGNASTTIAIGGLSSVVPTASDAVVKKCPRTTI